MGINNKLFRNVSKMLIPDERLISIVLCNWDAGGASGKWRVTSGA